MSGRTPSAAPVTTDPWAAFGYIVSGVAVYGLAGWGLGRWLGAAWLIPVGVVFGAVLGIYMVIARFRVGMAHLDSVAGGEHDDVNAVSPTTPTDRQSSDGPTGPDGRQTTSRGADA
ncbi:AtpZ/AtpI family protein [Jatrophihabitans sp. YIM 134969]